MTSILTRRNALLGLTAAVTLGRASLAMAAAPTDRRLVVILLRGAMDGLAVLPPYGDPAFADLRGALAPKRPGEPDGLLDLGGFYGLHPALTGLHALYLKGDLLPVHAVAGPVRTRSHFEAQDIMESGADHRMSSGWLNRAVQDMAQTGPNGAPIAIGVSLPLLLRGTALVGAYAPQSFQQPQPDLYARLVALHDHDPVTGPAIRQGLQERGFTGATLHASDPNADRSANKYAFPALAAAAGRLLAAPDGPRIAAMELGGWDTHAYQAQRLVTPLTQLDQGITALHDALGDAWRQTAILVITEFGRTAHVNGTSGTDHGTGAAAFLAGGAIAGGQVRADWPGLAPSQLFEARDLQPTLDVRALAKGLLAAHLRLPQTALSRAFPNSDSALPTPNLIRT